MYLFDLLETEAIVKPFNYVIGSLPQVFTYSYWYLSPEPSNFVDRIEEFAITYSVDQVAEELVLLEEEE